MTTARRSKIVAQVDVVICGTDNRPSKLLINQLRIEAGVVAVYSGAFRRAYGGQILRVLVDRFFVSVRNNPRATSAL
jgi:molybdopterin/thiamine biosynthesis adenylyltransferase